MEKRTIYRIGFAMIMLILGVIFQVYNIGSADFLGFGSVGNWMIYIGLVSVAVMMLQGFAGKKRKADERSYYIADKANRITFLAVIIAGFAVILVDGISAITMPYSLFMSYFVCGILSVYAVSYYALLRKY